MADIKKFKFAQDPEFSDNDPFAELTRIIGFEPRKQDGKISEDDLSLELEQELLGELDSFDDQDVSASDLEWPDRSYEPVRNLAHEPANDRMADHSAAPQGAPFYPEVTNAAPYDDSDLGFDDDIAASLQADLDALGATFASLSSDREPSHAVDGHAMHEQPSQPYDVVHGERYAAARESDPDFDLVDMDFSAEGSERAGSRNEDLVGELTFDREQAEPESPAVSFHPVSDVDQSSTAYSSPGPSDDIGDLENELSALLGSPSTVTDVSADDAMPEPDFEADEVAYDEPEVAYHVGAAQAADESHALAVFPEGEFDLSDDLAAELDQEFFVEEAEGRADPVLVDAGSYEPQDDVAEPSDVIASDESEVQVSRVEAEAYDPFAQLAAMAKAPLGPVAFTTGAVSASAAPGGYDASFESPEPEPVALDPDLDIETTEVPEESVAMADDLDLPVFAEERAPAPAQPFDDLDEDYNALIGDLQPVEGHSAGTAEPEHMPEDELRLAIEDVFADDEFEDDRSASLRPYEVAAAGAALGAGAYAASRAPGSVVHTGREFDRVNADATSDFDVEPFDDEVDFAEPVVATHRGGRNRGFMIAGAVAAVALIGAAGAFYLSSGSGSNGPTLVRADDGPVKVRPENPGGTTVPNQDNQVYDRVTTGPTESAPAQERLVSTAEEPVDLADRTAPTSDDSLPMVDSLTIPSKSEERVAPTAAEDETIPEEVAAVAPRRVRTMVVRPDGTMVPREEPAAPAEALPQSAAQAVATDPAQVTPAAASGEISAQPAAQPSGATVVREAVPNPSEAVAPAAASGDAAQVAAVDPTAAPAADPTAGETTPEGVTEIVTPNRVPIAPSRPSDQPVSIVGEVRRDQVASLPTNTPEATATTSEWAVQIASQPTREGAQATYADLSGRYGSLLGGRGVNIVPAEIDGRGTFYRVRVSAESRNDALTLCNRYKAAGGNCFVSR